MKYLHRLLAVASAAFFVASSALAQTSGTVTQHAFAIGKGAGQTGYVSLLCGSAQLAVGQSAAAPICRTLTGDVTLTAAGVTAIGATKVTSAMLNADVYSTAHTWAGQQTFVAPVLGTPASGTATNLTGLPVSTGLSGAGTGVLTALGVNVGSAGAFVVNGGALGTPSSGTLTSATGLPVSTGITGFGTGVATALGVNVGTAGAVVVNGGALGTPSSGVATNLTGTASGLTAGNVTTNANLTGAVTSVGNAASLGSFTSANLRGALSDEVGTGAAYFVGGALGTPASGTLTNATGLPVSTGISGLASGIASWLATPSSANLATALTDETGSGAAVFAVSPALTGTPTAPTAAGSDNSTKIATTAYVDAQVAGGVAGVASLNGSTGAVTSSVVKQIFTASGTYTPTTGMDHAIIECQASGGGGGGTTGTAGSLFTAGGGESGGYSKTVVTAATVGASQVVTVGNAGAGGAAGSNNGVGGGDVAVGSLCIAKGGAGGGFSASGTFGVGGSGSAVAGTGDLAIPGRPGSSGLIAAAITGLFSTGGNGGDSFYGNGGVQPTPVASASSTGVAASGYGAGGSGAHSHNTATTAAGGDGSKGVVFITEFVVN